MQNRHFQVDIMFQVSKQCENWLNNKHSMVPCEPRTFHISVAGFEQLLLYIHSTLKFL